jgi:aerobic C4-dicarboxylate transport protein
VKTPFYRILYVQVLFAIALAIALGCTKPELAARMKPLGDGFVHLVGALITPLVFCTVTLGIAGSKSAKSVGKIGGLAFIYFEVLTTFALIVGLLVVNFVAPGVGMNVDVTKLDASKVATYVEHGKNTDVTGFLLDLIPTTLLSPLTGGNVLQTLVVALLFGFAMQHLGQRARPVRDLIASCSVVVFRIVEIVMRAAPIGAFGAMAFTIGSQGVASLIPLGKMMLTFYASCALFVFGVLGLVARVHGFSLLQLLRYVREEILLVLGTSSSEAALPRLLVKLENLGVRKDVVHLVLPAGYSFNLDGTCLYLTIAAVFLAQATNTPLALGDQVMLLLVLLVSSKGAAGVAGSG